MSAELLTKLAEAERIAADADELLEAGCEVDGQINALRSTLADLRWMIEQTTAPESNDPEGPGWRRGTDEEADPS